MDENNKDIDETKIYKIKTKKERKKGKMNPKVKKNIKIALMIILLVILIAAGIMIGKIYGVFKSAKISVEDMKIKYENSIVKDIDGNAIAVLSGDENRDPVEITEMSQYLPKAFVAIEDERFYEHSGVDIKRTAAATVKYGLSKIGIGSASYGGSTITQQLIKNITEEDDRTWERKVSEIARAHYIEKELSKSQILELYLNMIYLGGNTYGVEIASNYYFSKSSSELTLAESAFLAGINHAPNYYNPFEAEDNEAIMEKINGRTKTVLTKMKDLGTDHKAGISEEEYNAAIAEVDAGLKFNKGTIRQTVYSYHTDAAIEEIIADLRELHPDWNRDYAELYVKSSGLTIYTTQNTSIQQTMEEEVKDEDYILKSKTTVDEDGNPVTAEAAMVLIDHETGYVLATVGGLGEKTTSFGLNRATQSVRQTGSTMKPLAVVAPGIAEGILTAATAYDDVPSGSLSSFHNYGWSNKGLMTIRYAIADSQNIPMLKGMQVVTPEASFEFLESLGITTLDEERDKSLSLALGGLTWGVSPLEMAGAYATIANNGQYIEPTFYTKVVDSDGETVLTTHQETRTVMSSAAAYVVKEVLTQSVKTGTSTYCKVPGISTAAKTGTTNDDKDRWFAGFTPYYTAITWFGYDDPEEIKWSGYNPAALIWKGVMVPVHEDLANKTFAETRPSGVVTATVCKSSGLRATEACKNDPRGSQAYTEYFVKGTVPTKECTTHVEVEICLDSNPADPANLKLATEFCTNKEKKVFITRENWETDRSWEKAKDAEYMLTITETCPIHVEAPDTTMPIITLKGNSNIELKVNDKYTEEGATATDDKDGDITANIVVTGSVDTSKEGTYVVTYSVKDTAGNEAKVTRTVVVKKVEEKDTVKPTIALKGKSSIELKVNDQYTEEGATATDNKDGDITSKIVVTGSVDTSKEGTYKIIYSVKDTAGNEATVTRTVVVKKPVEDIPVNNTTPPSTETGDTSTTPPTGNTGTDDTTTTPPTGSTGTGDTSTTLPTGNTGTGDTTATPPTGDTDSADGATTTNP